MPRKKGQPPRPKGIYGRVRAAIAYADLPALEVARALGVSTTTVSRWQGNGEPPDLEEQKKLAKLCEVPLDFLQHGFPMQASSGTEWLEGEVRDLARRLKALEEARSSGARFQVD